MTSLSSTFGGAASFVGNGLSMWNVENVNVLSYTFYQAAAFNAIFRTGTFKTSSCSIVHLQVQRHFTGEGLPSWQIRADAYFVQTFLPTPSIPDCTKREIYDSWSPISAMFRLYHSDFQNLTCPCASASSVYLVEEVVEGCVPTVDQPCEVECPALHQRFDK